MKITPIIITLFTLVAYTIVIFKKERRANAHNLKPVLKAVWWNKQTAKRVANFCDRIENRCFKDSEYYLRHKGRLNFANSMEKLLNLYLLVNK